MYNGDCMDMMWDYWDKEIIAKINKDTDSQVLGLKFVDWVKSNPFKEDGFDDRRSDDLLQLFNWEVTNLIKSPAKLRNYGLELLWDEHASLTRCYWYRPYKIIVYEYDDDRMVDHSLFPPFYMKDPSKYPWRHISFDTHPNEYLCNLYSGIMTRAFDEWFYNDGIKKIFYWFKYQFVKRYYYKKFRKFFERMEKRNNDKKEDIK